MKCGTAPTRTIVSGGLRKIYASAKENLQNYACCHRTICFGCFFSCWIVPDSTFACFCTRGHGAAPKILSKTSQNRDRKRHRKLKRKRRASYTLAFRRMSQDSSRSLKIPLDSLRFPGPLVSLQCQVSFIMLLSPHPPFKSSNSNKNHTKSYGNR